MTCTHNPTKAQVAHPVLVLDVSSLRFRFGPGRKTVSVLTATGQHLGTVPLPRAATQAEAAWAALTEAGDAVLRAPAGCCGDLVGHRVALYNPFTAQIGWRTPDGDQVTFTGPPRPLPAGGTPMTAARGRSDGWTLLEGGHPVAGQCQVGLAEAARALAAYA